MSLSLSIGLGLHSRRAAVAATVAAAFALADWSLANANADPTNDGVNDGVVNVTINSYPDNGGSLISDIEYRIDGGAWTSAQTISSFTITGLTNAVSRNVELRAVNAIGSSAASDVKTATPYVKGGGWARVDTSFIPATVKNVKTDGGAKGDAIVGLTGTVTASSATFTDPNAVFVAGDVGKSIHIKGAGTAGAVHKTTISAVTNGTTITLAAAAVTSVSSVPYVHGTDDTAAINSVYTGSNWAAGNGVYFPAGQYFYDGNINSPTGGRSGCVLYGDGSQLSVLVCAGDGNNTGADHCHVLITNFQNGIFRDFGIYAPLTTGRGSGTQTAQGYGFQVTTSSDCTLHNIWVQGSSNGHIMLTGGPARIRVEYCKVFAGTSDPGADGIHFDGAGVNCVAQYCVGDGIGDDAFAAISTVTGGKGSGIQFLDNLVLSTTHASGIRADGWDNVTIARNRVFDTDGAGIKLSADNSFNGSGVNGATIEDNYLEGVCTDPDLSFQAAIYMYTGEPNQVITGVTIQNNAIVNPLCTHGIRGLPSSATEPIDATLTGNVMTNTTGNMTVAVVEDPDCTFTDGGGNLFNGSAIAPPW